MNPEVLLAGGVAAAMAGATAVLLRSASETATVGRAATILLVFGMMVSMLAGALLALSTGGPDALSLGIWGSGAALAILATAVFVVLVRYGRIPGARGDWIPAPLARRRAFAGAVVGLALASELLMGWTFPKALGEAAAGSGVFALVAAVDSPWFLFTMGAEMVLTAYLVRRRLGPSIYGLLTLQGGIMILSPPALESPLWRAGAIGLSSALMIGLFVLLMEHLYRHRQLTAGLSRYLLVQLAIYAAMMAGMFVWLSEGNATGFAVAVLLEMVAFFFAVLAPESLASGETTPWQLRPGWTFALLSTIFVAELFMGAVLDVAIQPSTYPAAFGALPLMGGPAAVLDAAASNLFWFVATVTASTWFLVMMGVEMGALVVFKIRESRNLENRIRLALMLGSYAAFAVFYPSIYFSLVFPNAPASSQVPVLGWSMGLGSFPLAVGVFGAILATYAITGALVALFGRRAICSVFCTAPLMYQGTALDTMKSFNRSSPIARKYLSSRFSEAYQVTSGVTLVALVGTSLLSYLNTQGITDVHLAGTDPSVFLFALSFSVLWYVMFVTIPYTGNYNCVTMGWCYTGAVAQAFHRIGFFKLKVRDRDVCKACTTLDCAKGCPVGLVDMPGHFRTTGEFRSTKCCGVGDCVEDCPYGNLYISDVRHWVRRRLGRPEVEPARPLPMYRAGVAGTPKLRAALPNSAPGSNVTTGPQLPGFDRRPAATSE